MKRVRDSEKEIKNEEQEERIDRPKMSRMTEAQHTS